MINIASIFQIIIYHTNKVQFGFQIVSATALWYVVTRIGLKYCILISVGFMAFLMAFLSTVACFDNKHTPAMSPGPRVCNVMPIYGSIGMLPMAHDEEPNFQGVETIGKIIFLFLILEDN